jgi:ribosomal subunit interface protein
MQIIISGRGVVLTPSFKTTVERKVTKLTRILPEIVRARVACDAEKFRRSVRLTVAARRRTFASEATAADFLTAVDDAIDAVRRQVCEDKNRRRSLGARVRGSREAQRAEAEVAMEPVA